MVAVMRLATKDRQLVGGANGLPVEPQMSSGAHGSKQTAAAGASYVQLDSQACKQLTIANNTGTAIGVTKGGAGGELPVFDQSYYTFYGIANANELYIRRVDQSNTQITVPYRWEA